MMPLDQIAENLLVIEKLKREIKPYKSMIAQLLFNECNQVRINLSIHNVDTCHIKDQKQDEIRKRLENGESFITTIPEDCHSKCTADLSEGDAIIVVNMMLASKQAKLKALQEETENLIMHHQTRQIQQDV